MHYVHFACVTHSRHGGLLVRIMHLMLFDPSRRFVILPHQRRAVHDERLPRQVPHAHSERERLEPNEGHPMSRANSVHEERWQKGAYPRAAARRPARQGMNR